MLLLYRKKSRNVFYSFLFNMAREVALSLPTIEEDAEEKLYTNNNYQAKTDNYNFII